jgi:hypothetical protein
MTEETIYLDEGKRANARTVYNNKLEAAWEEVRSGRRMVASLTKQLEDQQQALVEANQELERRYTYEMSISGAGHPSRLPSIRQDIRAIRVEIGCVESGLRQEQRRLAEAEARLAQVQKGKPSWLD